MSRASIRVARHCSRPIVSQVEDHYERVYSKGRIANRASASLMFMCSGKDSTSDSPRIESTGCYHPSRLRRTKFKNYAEEELGIDTPWSTSEKLDNMP